MHTEPNYPDNSFLVFGKESVGLSEDFLKQYPNSCIRIPMRDTLRCLNLSNSVAIASYEVLRQWNFEGLSSTGSPQTFLWES
jgi:tRNA (cytidine/uridine-2'-O-)-methyltransferase